MSSHAAKRLLPANQPRRGGLNGGAVHMMSPGRRGLPLLKRAIAEKLAPMGVNALIVEVNYGFAFQLASRAQ